MPWPNLMDNLAEMYAYDLGSYYTMLVIIFMILLLLLDYQLYDLFHKTAMAVIQSPAPEGGPTSV